MDLLRWFLVVMAVLWVLWFIGGGPESGRTDRPFLDPPPPVGSGETYGPEGPPDTGFGWFSFRQRSENGDESSNESDIFQQSVAFARGGNPDAADAGEEYVVIEASRQNTEPVQITGWRIRSAVTGRSETIGEGVALPFLGRVNDRTPISLAPGEEAVVVTGRSPIGGSFRLNKCTGYFEQFQDFTPRIPRVCPLPREETDTYPGFMSDVCYDYVQDLSRCEVISGNPPIAVQQDGTCMEWLNETVNYSGCVSNHRNDADFYDPEWRVYLREGEELWRDRRETLLLLDPSGETRDSLSY